MLRPMLVFPTPGGPTCTTPPSFHAVLRPAWNTCSFCNHEAPSAAVFPRCTCPRYKLLCMKRCMECKSMTGSAWNMSPLCSREARNCSEQIFLFPALGQMLRQIQKAPLQPNVEAMREHSARMGSLRSNTTPRPYTWPAPIPSMQWHLSTSVQAGPWIYQIEWTGPLVQPVSDSQPRLQQRHAGMRLGRE